tara:strand:- start:1977 stop:3803 length:1827 start_codon:yes stop_codon:yes gene_type:complete
MGLTGKQVRDLINVHKTRTSGERAKWDRYLRYYRSEFWGENADMKDIYSDAEVAMETNYPYSFVDSMVSSIVPPNPQVTVVARNSEKKEFARYREALVNDTLKRERASTLLWRLATYVSVYGRGFLKGVWRFSRQRTEYRVIDPRFVFFDLSAERWEDIRYLVEVTTLTRDEFKRRAKAPLDPNKPRGKRRYNADQVKRANFGHYPAWLKPALKKSRDISSEAFDWITVYEVYDFTGKKYYHYLEDETEPLFKDDLPYRFVENPYRLLTFNDNMQSLEGISDVQLIDRQQQMLNELDTLELRHAQSSIPVTLFQAGLVDNPGAFIKDLLDATSPGDAVALHAKPGIGINEIIANTPTTQLSPSFETMRERITKTIEFTLGLPQFQRGVVGVADVATEVALAETAVRTRNGRRLQALQDVIEWMCRTTVGLYEEFLPSESDLPIRLTGRREALVVNRQSMNARNPLQAEDPYSQPHPMDYDYDVVPYSPTENSRTIQLRNLAQVLDLLSSSVDVDKRRLVSAVIDLLNLDPDLLISEEEKAVIEQQIQAQQMGMAPVGPGAPEKEVSQVNQRNIRDTTTAGGPVAATGPRVVLPTGAAGGPGDPAPKSR